MKIVAFGSKPHTGGKKAAYFLSQNLNYEFEDCTTNENCPQSVFRIATKYAVRANTPFTAVIAWSNVYSLELRQIFQQQPVVGFEDLNYFAFPGMTSNTDFNRVNAFESILCDANLVMNRWATMAYSLQEMFTSLDIPYVMYNLDQEIIATESTRYFIKNINRKRYIGVDNGRANVFKSLKKMGFKFDSSEGQKYLTSLLEGKLK